MRWHRFRIQVFVKAAAGITIEEDRVMVSFGRRANNPFLINAGHGETDIPIPWLENRWLQVRFI